MTTTEWAKHYDTIMPNPFAFTLKPKQLRQEWTEPKPHLRWKPQGGARWMIRPADPARWIEATTVDVSKLAPAEEWLLERFHAISQ